MSSARLLFKFEYLARSARLWLAACVRSGQDISFLHQNKLNLTTVAYFDMSSARLLDKFEYLVSSARLWLVACVRSGQDISFLH